MRQKFRSGVYQIINEVNGKFYVGSSVNIENRWGVHRNSFKLEVSRTRSLLFAAVRKYGVENFTFLVLEECEPIKDVILEREQFYIDTLKPVYNLMPKAGSRLGSKASPETIEIQRMQMAARMQTPQWQEQLQSISAAATAYMSDPENKQRYSELRKGKTFEDIFGEERAKEVLAKQSENRTGKHVGFDPWNKGVPLTDDQKEKLSVARNEWIAAGGEPWNKGVPMSKELYDKLEAGGFWEVTDQKRQHMSEAQLGKEPWNKDQTMDEAYCQSMAGAAKARHEANPELQAALTEAARLANTGKSRPQDVCDRISESNRNSEARKTFAESRRGIARTDELKQKVSEGLQTSEKAKAYHQGRIGKSRGNNPSGQYGVIWDKSRSKWQVRVQGKSYGRFEQLEDAAAKVQEVLAMLQSAAG